MQRSGYVSALLLVVALTGCGSGPGASSPTAIPTSASATAVTPPATPAPQTIPLTEAKAAQAFADVAVPAGFRIDLQCPPKTKQDKRICAAPASDTVVWSASRTYLGAELPGGSGLPATVTINLTAAKTEATADAFYERQVRGLRPHVGSYDIAVKKKSGTYAPGQRGRGTLTPKTSGDWRGAELNDEFVLVFETSTSKKLTSGTCVQRRGVYVLNVTWTAAKATAIASLRDLPDGIATALDRRR